MHTNTRAHTRECIRRHTRMQETTKRKQNEYCLPSESVARYFRLSLLMEASGILKAKNE